jgi:hypothetical protein
MGVTGVPETIQSLPLDVIHIWIIRYDHGGHRVPLICHDTIGLSLHSSGDAYVGYASQMSDISISRQSQWLNELVLSTCLRSAAEIRTRARLGEYEGRHRGGANDCHFVVSGHAGATIRAPGGGLT